MNKEKDFCTTCRKETFYTLQKEIIKATRKGREHIFEITVAICDECGEEMNPPGLIDLNISEIQKEIDKWKNIKQ